MHHHTNGSIDLLVSGQQGVNPSREAISILSGKYKRFMFVHPVIIMWKGHLIFEEISQIIEMFHNPGDLRMSLFSTKEKTPTFSDL